MNVFICSYPHADVAQHDRKYLGFELGGGVYHLG